MTRRLALLVPILALLDAALSAQESDYINMRSPGSRAIIFETPNTNGLDRVSDVSRLGDVDGDGTPELGLVYGTRSTGEPAYVLVIPGGAEWAARNTIGPDLPRTSRFSSASVSAGTIGDAGDLNGDGFADLVFSATRFVLPEHAEDFEGVVFIVYGEAGFERSATFEEIRDGAIRATLIYNSSDPLGAHRPGGSGGMAVADVNGNGTPDLVLAGHTLDTFDGVISVLLDPGDPGPRVDLADLGDSVPGFSIAVSRPPDEIDRAGDFDGDGFEDILLSGRDGSDGWAVLFYGREDPRGVYDLGALGPEGGEFLVLHPPAKQDADGFGFGGEGQVCGVGDLNGDGFDELLLGESYAGANTPGDPRLPPAFGRAHLVYGGPRLVTTIAVDQISADRRKVIHGEEAEFRRDDFGGELADAGDVNGDGLPDVVIGASNHENLWGRDGEAYLVYGQAELPDDVYIDQGFHGIRLSGGYPSGRLGLAVGAAGDFNADGNADFFVLEQSSSSQAEEPGRLYVVLGTGDGVPPLRLAGVEPPFGPQRGSVAEVVGSGFRGEVEVYLGARRVIVHEASATRLRIEAPPSETLGLVDVRVVVEGVEVTLPGGYEYIPDFPRFDLNDLGDAGLIVEPSGRAAPGTALGDLTGDGIAELAVAGWLGDTWEVTIVIGGPGLPERLGPSDARARVLVAATPGSPRVGRLAIVGDVNDDGFDDLAVSLAEAEAYLFFGRSELASEMTIEEEVLAGRAVVISVFGGPGEDHQLDFAPLEDVDGDGITDLAIGIPGDFAGEVVVVPGRRAWPDLIELSDPRSIIARLDGQPGATRFGRELVAAGDVDGDGIGDLLSAAYALDDADASPAFFIPVVPPLILDAEAVVRIEVEHEPGSGTAQLGRLDVAPAGDTDGDGRADIVIGYEGGGFQIQGTTFLVRELPSGSLLRIPVDPAEPDGIVRFFGEANTQASQPTGIGDFNGDGYDDIAIRAWSWPVNPTTIHGVAAVIFCRPEMPARIELGELRAHGLRFEADPVSAFLMSTPNTGDLNGDGRPDFAVRKNQNVPPSSDTVYVIYSPYREASFRRGDANRDGRIDISDGTYILTFLFLGGARPPCEDAADADDLGSIELTDGVYLLNHLFLGGPPPPPPYPGEGADGTADGLGCVGF